MADHTKIEWADATVNAVNGCTVYSPGCTNCYAMRLAGTRLRDHPSRAGLTMPTKAGPVWTGEVRLNEDQLLQPLKWKRPRRIFWNAHGDLFHESAPDEWIDRVFAVCALTPQHQHLILTKRSARMRAYCASRFGGDGEELLIDAIEAIDGFQSNGGGQPGKPLPNVWLGVSVEDQARADERVPDLLGTPAAVRWLSCEPLLGPVDLEPWLEWPDGGCELPNGAYFGCAGCEAEGPSCVCPRDRAHYEVTEGPRDAQGCPDWVHAQRITLDWIVVGGESGPDARPMHPDWARSLRDQCQAAGVPFFFKQWGEFVDALTAPLCRKGVYLRDQKDFMARVGKKAAGRLLDGVEWSEYPA